MTSDAQGWVFWKPRIENPFSYLLLSSDLEVSSLSSGDVIGLLKLALYAGPGTLEPPSQTPDRF